MKEARESPLVVEVNQEVRETHGCCDLWAIAVIDDAREGEMGYYVRYCEIMVDAGVVVR